MLLTNPNLRSFTVPPKLAPFVFPSKMQAGHRATVTCAIVEGDSPIVISWQKDGRPLIGYKVRSFIRILSRYGGVDPEFIFNAPRCWVNPGIDSCEKGENSDRRDGLVTTEESCYYAIIYSETFLSQRFDNHRRRSRSQNDIHDSHDMSAGVKGSRQQCFRSQRHYS